jgi:hypothetical protein
MLIKGERFVPRVTVTEAQKLREAKKQIHRLISLSLRRLPFGSYSHFLFLAIAHHHL